MSFEQLRHKKLFVKNQFLWICLFLLQAIVLPSSSSHSGDIISGDIISGDIIFLTVVATGLLLLFLGYTALENRYYLTSPQQPNPETGRVYPYNVSQGIVFYQTLAEKRRLDALEYSSGFLMFGGIALALWKAPRKRHRSG